MAHRPFARYHPTHPALRRRSADTPVQLPPLLAALRMFLAYESVSVRKEETDTA